MAIVSIKSQRVTLYDAEGWIFRAPVSTGTTGRETPAGVFAVVEKDKDHRSTMYDDAEMPNMQRITWNGIALHGGPLPGYAASHGCVRMPFGFAEKLFDKTRIGMRIIISPNDAAPVEYLPPGAVHAEGGGDRGGAGPGRGARPRGCGGRQGSRRRQESRRDDGPRGGRADNGAAQAGTGQDERRRRTRLAEKVLATAKTDQAKTRAEDRKQKAAAKAEEAARSSTPPRPRRNPRSRGRRRKGRRESGRQEEGRPVKAATERQTRARAGLDLCQPRDAEALRAAQHAQAGAGRRRRGVRHVDRGAGHDP